MPGFGDGISSDYTKVKNGRYPATIISAKVVLDDKGFPKLHPESHKQSVKVGFQLDEESDNGPIALDRVFNITFGKNNKNGAYAAWAQVIEVFCGIPCGDKAQYHIGEAEMVGKRGVLWTKNVESNGNKYTNIVDFEKIEDDGPPVAVAPRVSAAPATSAAESIGLDPEDLESLPF